MTAFPADQLGVGAGRVLRRVELFVQQSRQPRQRRTPVRSPVRGRKRGRWDPFRVAATALAVLIACSLIATGVGTLVFDLRDPRPDEVQEASDAREGEFERTLRDTLQENPDDSAALVGLANFRAQLGDLGEAIDLYEQALEAAPNDASIRLDFGRTLADGGRSDDAEVQYQKMLAAEPESIDGHFYLAELYRVWQPPRREDARRHYAAVIEFAPDSFLAEQARNELNRLGGLAATPTT